MAKYKILKTNSYTSPPFNVGDIVDGKLGSTGQVVNVVRDFNGKHTTFGFSIKDLVAVDDNALPKTDKDNIQTTNEDFAKKVKLYGRIITASSIGGLALGLLFAYKRKSKVGGYIGWGLLGSAIFGGTAFAIYGKKMVQATLGNVADNLGSTQTSGEKPLDGQSVLNKLNELNGTPVDESKAKDFLDTYNSLNDKEKLAYTELMLMGGNCKKNSPNDIMACYVKGQQDLVSKYGAETLKNLNAKLTTIQTAKK